VCLSRRKTVSIYNIVFECIFTYVLYYFVTNYATYNICLLSRKLGSTCYRVDVTFLVSEVLFSYVYFVVCEGADSCSGVRSSVSCVRNRREGRARWSAGCKVEKKQTAGPSGRQPMSARPKVTGLLEVLWPTAFCAFCVSVIGEKHLVAVLAVF
jgi:hypothetical protein